MNLIYKLIIFNLIVFIIIGSIPIFSSNHSKIIYSDNFDNSKSLNWIENVGYNGSWTIDNGSYVGKVVKNIYDTPSVASYVENPLDNFDLRLDIKNDLGVDKYLLFNFHSLDYTYGINIKSAFPGNGNIVELVKNNYSIKKSLKVVPFINSTNTWYDVHVLFNRGLIKLYIDDNLILEYQDEHPLNSGGIALMAWPGAYAGIGSTTTVRYDNLVVRDLDLLSVSDYKQNDSRWKSDPLGNSGLTIGSHGCYMTSITNVLNYYGYNNVKIDFDSDDWYELTPKVMNSWLSNNSGYDLGGYLIPQGVLKFASKNKSISEVTLPEIVLDSRSDYGDFVYDDEFVNMGLEELRPIVSKVKYTYYDSNNAITGRSTHFLNVIGKKDSLYYVNDPLNIGNTIDNKRYLKELWGYRDWRAKSNDSVRISSIAETSVGEPVGFLINTILPTEFIIISESGDRTGYWDGEIYEEIPQSMVEINDPIASLETDSLVQESTLQVYIPSNNNEIIYKILFKGTDGKHNVMIVNYPQNGNITSSIHVIELVNSNVAEYVGGFDGSILNLVKQEEDVNFDMILQIINIGLNSKIVKVSEVQAVRSQVEVAKRMYGKSNVVQSVKHLNLSLAMIEKSKSKDSNREFFVNLIQKINKLIRQLS